MALKTSCSAGLVFSGSGAWPELSSCRAAAKTSLPVTASPLHLERLNQTACLHHSQKKHQIRFSGEGFKNRWSDTEEKNAPALIILLQPLHSVYRKDTPATTFAHTAGKRRMLSSLSVYFKHAEALFQTVFIDV